MGIGLSMQGLLSMADMHTNTGIARMAQNQISSMYSSIMTLQLS